MNILTQTAIINLLKCPKSFKTRFEDGYMPLQDNENITMGRLWHGMLEQNDITEAKRFLAESFRRSPSLTLQPFMFAKLKGMIEAYYNIKGFIPNIIATELTFTHPLTNPDTGRQARDVVVAGKVDGLAHDNGGYWIIEHKTASSIDVNHMRTLDINLQLHVYKRFLEKQCGIKVEGVIYDIIMKPGIRPLKATAKKEAETPDEYYYRVTKWYTENIEKAFHREKFRTQDIDIERQVWQYHKEILWRRAYNFWPRNPDACSNYFGICQYYGYCSTGENPVFLQNNFKIGNPFPELPGHITKLATKGELNGQNAINQNCAAV